MAHMTELEVLKLLTNELNDMYDALTDHHVRISSVDRELEVDTFTVILQVERRSGVVRAHIINNTQKFGQWRAVFGDFEQTWSKIGRPMDGGDAYLDLGLVERLAIWITGGNYL